MGSRVCLIAHAVVDEFSAFTCRSSRVLAKNLKAEDSGPLDRRERSTLPLLLPVYVPAQIRHRRYFLAAYIAKALPVLRTTAS